MCPIPIFDTNIFGHAQSGIIPKSDWNRLLQHRPGIGWPLSLVSALELLVDLDNVNEESFADFRERIDLAYRLANGSLLEDPKFLICTSLLHVTPPDDVVPPSALALSMHMSVIRRARSLAQLLSGTVKPKRNRPSGLRGTDAPKSIVSDVKRQWIRRVQRTATVLYPDWQTCFEQTGKRLPPELRKAISYRKAREAYSAGYLAELLDWLGVEKRPETIALLQPRLDAVLRFTTFVVDEFLKTNYSLEKNSSDVFDQFQLHYLALDGCVLVSNDPDMWKRTEGSPQAPRIVTFEDYLRSL